jgi:TerC family integral membrane protein
MYGGFFAAVLVMVLIDMFALNRAGQHKVSVREALGWSAIWFTIAMLFNGWLWWHIRSDTSLALDEAARHALADQKALEFLTGYLIEKSLAVDNIFVFLLLFSFFKVPDIYQRRVLVYGVVGAIVMRAIMIAVGAVLVAEFAWILYVFGAFLVFTGLKMMLPEKEEKDDLTNNPVLKWLRRHLRVTEEFHGEKFFIIRNGVRWATPLFLVLVMIELTDLVFAVDSIPAIFSVTQDPFIVMTSNIFAILGLRALYFLLADIADRFHLLKYGLAAVLTFIGMKMLLLEVFHIPVVVSLAVVFLLLTASIVASLLVSRKTAG